MLFLISLTVHVISLITTPQLPACDYEDGSAPTGHTVCVLGDDTIAVTGHDNVITYHNR